MEENTESKSRVTKGHINKPVINKAIFILVFAVLLVSASFYAGILYQKNHGSVSNGTSTLASGRNGAESFGGGRFAGSDRVIGQVTAISSSSITVQDVRSGTSSTFAIVSTTQISDNGSSVSSSDISDGETVFITKDTSSPSNAARILVNPSFGGYGGASTSPSTTVAPGASIN